MTGIDPILISEIVAELQNYKVFATQRTLHSFFSEGNLGSLRPSLPDAPTPKVRIVTTVEFLSQRTVNEENALQLFLNALIQRYPSSSENLRILVNNLAYELENIGDSNKWTPNRMFTENPYIFGVPIRGQENFFGRQEELYSIFKTLDSVGRGKKQDLAIVGPRRIGKSSLLYRLMDLLKDHQDFVAIYLDLQETPSLFELLNDCIEKIEDSYKQKGFPIRLPNFSLLELDSKSVSTGKLFRFFRKDISLLSELIETNGLPRLVLMFDEIDLLMSFGDQTILGRFRALIQHTFFAVFIVAGSTLLNSLLQDHGSPFFNIFKIMSLSPLSTDAARALVEVPANRIEMIIERSEVDTVLRYAGNNPYFTQSICHYLVEELNEQSRKMVYAEDVTKVIKESIQYLSLHIDYIWNSVTKVQRAILYSLAELGYPEYRDNIIFRLAKTHDIAKSSREQELWFDVLIDEQILTQYRDARYWFIAQLYVDWILTNTSKERVWDELSDLYSIKATETKSPEKSEKEYIDKKRIYQTDKPPNSVTKPSKSPEPKFPTANRREIYQFMIEFLSLEDIKYISFTLDIEYDNIAGVTKNDKVRELILYLERYSRLEELLPVLGEMRPQIRWDFDE